MKAINGYDYGLTYWNDELSRTQKDVIDLINNTIKHLLSMEPVSTSKGQENVE